jgi:hypothetical protein
VNKKTIVLPRRVCNRLDEKGKETLTSSLGQGKMHKAKAVLTSTSHEIWNKENLEERRRGSETVAHLHSNQKRETIGIINARRNTDIFIPRNPGFTNRARRSRKIDNNLKPDYTSSSSLRNKTSTQKYNSGNDIIVID